MEYQKILILLSIVAIAILAYVSKKIDFKGALLGALLAAIIFFSNGIESLFTLFLFFLAGSIASSWKKEEKIKLNLAQENSGARGISNVLANGGAAGVLSILSMIFPELKSLFNYMIISSFATACSDTLSSELGNIYGKRYFNILTFKSSLRGLDGTVSTRGLWFGVFGSLLIGLGTLPFAYEINGILIIAISGFSGNLTDSVLGATLQQRGFINNHQVNFLATTFGAVMAMVLYLLFNF